MEALKGSFECDPSSWYVQIVDAVSVAGRGNQEDASEDALMSLVRDEMAQFYDIANDREFGQIKQKYPNARMVLYKVSDKVEEMDR